MAEPARKYPPEDILPEDAVLGPGTYQNVDTGRLVRKDRFGPLPPSGKSKRYVMLSDDPTYGLSPDEARAHREEVSAEDAATSYEEPTESRIVRTGEIASPGTYECTKDRNRITLKHEGHMPPCSVDGNTEWRRVG